MFYLVGLGLKPSHLTLEAMGALKSCASIFMDGYTSQYAEGSASELEELLGKKVERLGREEIEDGFSPVLERAGKENIAVCVFGAPLFATTHVQLLLDCREKGVAFQIVQGVSVQACLPELGLDGYKFGRTLTIVSPKPNYAPEGFFDQLEANQQAGLHSMCLLDLDTEHRQLMDCAEAAKILLAIASARGKTEWLEKLKAIAVGGLGTPNVETVFGSLSALSKAKLEAFPQSLVIVGALSEKEQEALNLFGVEK